MFLLPFALVGTFLLGCSGSPTNVSTPDDCVTFDEASCIDSSVCTLTQAEENRPYTCRQSTDDCELGFRQATDTAEQCEQQEGCTFVPGRCYCAPGTTCVCGGGPPPQCSSSNVS